MAKIRVLLAEDHETVRQGLKLLINRQPDMEVVGEAGDGNVAVERVGLLKPTVAVVDVSMPHMNGLAATRAIRASNGPSAKAPILAVTADVMRDDVERCRASGMNGHVPKPINPARLMSALMSVLEGGEAFPAQPTVAEAA